MTNLHFVNDDKTAFVAAEVKKSIKVRDVEDEIIAVLKKYTDLAKEEKTLKKQIKEDNAALIIKTKAAIEQLTDEQIREFLKAKWITPVVTELFKLPVNIVNELISKLEVLSKKYETTFEEVDEEIKETEKSLCTMIDDLVGNDFDMQGLAELKKLLGGV